MKKIIFFLWIVALYSWNSQSQINNKKIEKQNMEYFNIEKYKDWEIDKWLSDESSKYYKKGNDRVEINFFNSGIKVSLTNLNTGYEKVKGFSNVTKGLISDGNNFYNFSIGKNTYYDENGRILKEIDNDIDFKFSVDQLIKKMQKECGLDINKQTKTIVVRRWTSSELKNKPLYCVFYDLKDESHKWKYILVNGTTGETLYTALFHFGDPSKPFPFDQYLEFVEKQGGEDSEYYKIYKSKQIYPTEGMILYDW